QQDNCSFYRGARIQINDEHDDQQRDWHDDHEPLFRTLHVFVLAAPKQVVTGRHHDALVGNRFIDGALRHFHVRADVDAFHIDVNPRIRNCSLAFNSHRCADQFQCCDLAQWNLRASGSGNNDLLECFEIFTKITIVTKIDAVALDAFHRRCEGHASERHFEHFLHVANGKSVARELVAIDVELDVVAADHAFAEYTGRTGHLTDNSFDFSSYALEFRKIGPGDLDAHGSFDSGGKHIDPRFDRHGPCIV